MTRFQALFIKYLRIRCEGTWRWVDLMYSSRYYYGLPYNENSTVESNQAIGADLCEEAMCVLNEKPEDGWN